MSADEVAELRRALTREQEKVRALQEIGAALGSTLDLDELLSLVLSRISQVMEADRSTLYLLDEERGELWSKFAQGTRPTEIRLKLGEGLAGWVARTGEPLNIPDAYQDVRFDGEWDRRTGYRTRSTLCVPMKNLRGRTIGVVQVLNKREGVFTAEDTNLLAALASQAAVSVENSKLFLSVLKKNAELLEIKEELERRVRELDVLFEIAHVSASAIELEELLEGVLARSMRAIDAEAASILLSDDETGDLHFRAAVGGEPEAVRRLKIEAGQGICGWVAKNGKPQVVNDVSSDPRHSEDISTKVGYHPKSVLCVPLVWEGGTGALELLNKAHGMDVFTEDDVRLATMIAGHISTAIAFARNREQRALEERMSTIGQFLSGVLHDLKTPMAVISGYVQLLGATEDDALREEYADIVLRQVDLINAMTRETLAFARGERKLWARKVYLHKFFEDIVEQIRRELEEKNVAVELQLRNRGIAKLDAHKIQRAVHNLARNAVEAIGKRGGRFVVGVDKDDDGSLLLTFTDDGPGISEEIRERLFQSFATHGKEGGTGLGLAIVKRIVEDHDGSISVTSRPGETVFTLRIPQNRDAVTNHVGEQGATDLLRGLRERVASDRSEEKETAPIEG